jgi:hypothetical protein
MVLHRTARDDGESSGWWVFLDTPGDPPLPGERNRFVQMMALGRVWPPELTSLLVHSHRSLLHAQTRSIHHRMEWDRLRRSPRVLSDSVTTEASTRAPYLSQLATTHAPADELTG